MKIEECFVGQRVLFADPDGTWHQADVMLLDLQNTLVQVNVFDEAWRAWLSPTRLEPLNDVPVNPVEPLGRFPHACPMCGERAYVGLTSVEHEGTGGCA